MVNCSMKFRSILPIIFLLLLMLTSVFAQRPWTTQVASFSSQSEAEQAVSRLLTKGIEAYLVKSNIPGKGIFYRVRVGRFASRSAAQAKGEKLKQQGTVESFFVTQYETPLSPPPRENTKPEAAPVTPAGGGRPRIATSDAPATVKQKAALNPSAARPEASDHGPEMTPSAPAAPASQPATLNKSEKPVRPFNPGFLLFEDKEVGYSFEHPGYWTGAAWSETERMSQNVDGGASFKSKEDAAFMNVIWNKLPGANDPKKYDNSLLVDTIIRSMGSGVDTQTLNELSRQIETEGNQIRTYLDMNALFRDPGTATTLNFLGKAVITRCREGILLVVVFHSQDAPAAAAANAERIIRSVRAPN